MKRKQTNPIALAAILFGLALLLNAFLCYRASTGRCAVHWLEWNVSKPFLMSLPFMFIASRRKVRVVLGRMGVVLALAAIQYTQNFFNHFKKA